MDHVQCTVQLFAAVAPAGAEHITSQTLRVHPTQYRLAVCHITHDQSHMLVPVDGVAETEHLEIVRGAVGSSARATSSTKLS